MLVGSIGGARWGRSSILDGLLAHCQGGQAISYTTSLFGWDKRGGKSVTTVAASKIIREIGLASLDMADDLEILSPSRLRVC